MWRSLDEVPADLGPTVVVIGNFDGVHRGHLTVIDSARQAAGAATKMGDLPICAVTFDPHPMAVLRPEHAPSMLTTIEQRADLLRTAGIEHVLALPFDRSVAAWTPEEFIERVLVEGLGAKSVVVGANFRFGARASGDLSSLRDAGSEHGFDAVGVELDGGPQVWSSTYIRTCLGEGDVAGAAEALGRPFSVRGTVTRGDQRGRDLGYPTANVPVGTGFAAPKDGVYAGRLHRLDTNEEFDAAISVGTNPTFAGDRERRIEAYVLDRDDLELYDVEVEVCFTDLLRGMVAFDGVEALVQQMAADVEHARAVLSA